MYINLIFSVSLILESFSVLQGAEIWNSDKCDKGCRSDANCPAKNSECQFFDPNSKCGLCQCQSGYQPKNNRCVDAGSADDTAKSNKKSKKSTTATTTTPRSTTTPTTTATSTSTSTTTISSTTKTTTMLTTTAVPTQGPPPASMALDCSAYDCGINLESSSDSNATQVRLQKLGTPPPGCKRSIATSKVVCKSALPYGDTTCFGAYCLPITDSKSYCICQPFKNGLTCQDDKNGKCGTGNGQVSGKGYTVQNKRFVNKNDPDEGSIWVRHFASSLSDCIKLCQWDTRCRSVNYGTLGGQSVCELLTISFAQGSGGILESWLQNSTGWSFTGVQS